MSDTAKCRKLPLAVFTEIETISGDKVARFDRQDSGSHFWLNRENVECRKASLVENGYDTKQEDAAIAAFDALNRTQITTHKGDRA